MDGAGLLLLSRSGLRGQQPDQGGRSQSKRDRKQRSKIPAATSPAAPETPETPPAAAPKALETTAPVAPEMPEISAPVAPQTPESTPKAPEQPSLLTRFKQFWLGAIAAAASGALSSVVSILLGLKPPPGRVPLIDAVRAHAWVAVLVALFAFVVAVAALTLNLRPNLLQRLRSVRGGSAGGGAFHDRITQVMSVLASGSTVTLLALVGVLLVRPDWCPSDLCARQVAVPGVHDEHLDVSYSAVQATNFLIPGDPHNYDRKHLPSTTGPTAVPTAEVGAGKAAVGDPLRIQIQVRDLDMSGTGMFIEQVALVVRQAQAIPAQTAVWYQPVGSSDLRVNPHTAVYMGQPAGGAFDATYETNVPGGHVTLVPGEVDQLTITVQSTVSVRVRFDVQVNYRIASEPRARTLMLGASFDVEFIDPRNWQPYTLSGGSFLSS